jgi:protein-S-isoprenylcysteine O-methyltransferase Ste14
VIADQLREEFIGGVWLAWLLYWWQASAGTKKNQRAESLVSRLSHIVPLLLGAVLIATRQGPLPGWLSIRLLPPSLLSYATGVTLLLVGLLLTVWARRHLATNWSGTVTLKQGHELIRTGPYRWVRHPIYSGLLLGFLGTAIARGELRGFLGLALILAAFVRKLRIEERWMREKFAGDYERYSAEVSALIPLIV